MWLEIVCALRAEGFRKCCKNKRIAKAEATRRLEPFNPVNASLSDERLIVRYRRISFFSDRRQFSQCITKLIRRVFVDCGLCEPSISLLFHHLSKPRKCGA